MGAKSPCFNTLIYVPAPAGTPYPGAYDTARARANQIGDMFPGAAWDRAIYPTVQIIMEPLTGTATQVIKPSGVSLSPGDPAPDQNIYTMLIQCRIVRYGSTINRSSMVSTYRDSADQCHFKLCPQAQFENPPGP